jgi:hypothetical protein
VLLDDGAGGGLGVKDVGVADPTAENYVAGFKLGLLFDRTLRPRMS